MDRTMERLVVHKAKGVVFCECAPLSFLMGFLEILPDLLLFSSSRLSTDNGLVSLGLSTMPFVFPGGGGWGVGWVS